MRLWRYTQWQWVVVVTNRDERRRRHTTHIHININKHLPPNLNYCCHVAYWYSYVP